MSSIGFGSYYINVALPAEVTVNSESSHLKEELAWAAKGLWIISTKGTVILLRNQKGTKFNCLHCYVALSNIL